MYFPLFIDLTEKNILVVGAGRIARRRIHTLLGFAGQITVIAPQMPEEWHVPAGADPDKTKAGDSSLAAQLILLERPFQDTDLAGRDLVLAATDDAALNRHIRDCCRACGIAVNVCTDARLCDFQFPSIVEDGPVVIGINASGTDHHLVKETRRRIEQMTENPDFQSKYEIG